MPRRTPSRVLCPRTRPPRLFGRRNVRRSGLLAGLTLSLALAGCGLLPDDGEDGGDSAPPPGGAATQDPAPAEVPDDLGVAVSDTREDSVYPEVGDPLVDALHQDLALAWTPERDHLDATQRMTFRATDDAASFQLDFDDALEIESLTVDGEEVDFERSDKDLVVAHPVRADDQYLMEMHYSGTPEPYDAPTTRSDFRLGVGWHVTDDHEVWTIQEPYGAFTWFATNDQPADKALYDFTLTVPEPWTGIANGELTDTTEADGLRTTTFHLAEPASSYLVTVAFGDYTPSHLESESGVPVTLWAFTDDPGSLGETAYAPDAIDWLEQYLGPYPFDTFGALIYDGESGMETQTMLTLGDTAYSTSRAVMVHELAHHWYGNTVSPADWSDVWMNEGMAMYFQGMWEAEQQGVSVDALMDEWATFEDEEREHAGPPADYDPRNFGSGNIYYGPALMWHELRQEIGDDAFFAMVRAWPEEQENGNGERQEYLDWVEQHTGEELTAFFRAWLLGPTTPPRD